MKRIFKNIIVSLALVLCSILLLLIALEVYLRLFPSQSITPGIEKTHPTRRYALKPLFKGKMYGIKFKINSLGLRDYERPPINNAYKIVILGDSITFGSGVEINKIFPKLIEDKLNDIYKDKPIIQVFNLGTPSYNTMQEYRYLIEAYDTFKPHMAIFEFTAENDSAMSADFYNSMNRSFIVRFAKDILRNMYSYNWLAGIFYSLIYKQKTRNCDDEYLALLNVNLINYQDDFEAWVETKKTFREIRQFCKDKDITLIFAIFANNIKIGETLEEDIMFPIVKKIISALEAAGIENIVIIDNAFRDYIGREGLLWVSPNDNHFSELAHKLAADEIVAYICNEKLLQK